MMLMKIPTSFRRKPESRRPAGMLHSILWIPAFAGMTEMDQTMIKADSKYSV
jgi:hypothetical protein